MDGHKKNPEQMNGMEFGVVHMKLQAAMGIV